MTNWSYWILASALFLALYDLAKKTSVRENAVLPTLLCSTCFGCAAFVLALIVGGCLPVRTDITALAAILVGVLLLCLGS